MISNAKNLKNNDKETGKVFRIYIFWYDIENLKPCVEENYCLNR